MTVYKRGGVWWMNFSYRGRRIQASTGQIDREAAEAVERRRKDQLRQQAHGVAIEPKLESPRVQDWAEVYFEDVLRRANAAKHRVRRPERIERLLRVALSFWGSRPDDPSMVYPDGVYHDLRLSDPIDDPSWLVRWEAWLAAPKAPRPRKDGRRRPVATWSGQTKNQYRSVMSQLFEVATRPQWRAATGVTLNPFVGGDRDVTRRRTVALTIDDLRAILGLATPHLQIAMAVALLAPKLRVANILGLRFDQHFSPDLEWLTVTDHKTAGATGKPLVAYVPQQLREILRRVKARCAPGRPWVVQYRGRRVKKIGGAVRGAVARAATTRPHLRYGREDPAGITFHTLRHSAATAMAELGIAPDTRRSVMGHEDIATTLWYTHLRPTHEIAPAEALSAALPIQDLVLVDRQRAVAVSVTAPRAKSRKSSNNRKASGNRSRARKRTEEQSNQRVARGRQ